MFGGLTFRTDENMAVSASSQGGLLLRIDPAGLRQDSLRERRRTQRRLLTVVLDWCRPIDVLGAIQAFDQNQQTIKLVSARRAPGPR